MQQGNEKNNKMVSTTAFAIALTLFLASCTSNPELDKVNRWPTRTPIPTNTLIIAEALEFKTRTPQPTKEEPTKLPQPTETPTLTEREALERLIKNSIENNQPLFLSSRWNVGDINVITGVIEVGDSLVPGSTRINIKNLIDIMRSALNIPADMNIIVSTNTIGGYRFKIEVEKLYAQGTYAHDGYEIVISIPEDTASCEKIKSKASTKDSEIIVDFSR